MLKPHRDKEKVKVSTYNNESGSGHVPGYKCQKIIEKENAFNQSLMVFIKRYKDKPQRYTKEGSLHIGHMFNKIRDYFIYFQSDIL